MGGGTFAAICAISSSEMTPGPLGMWDTSPSAEAPYFIASSASPKLAMQQILTRGWSVGCMAGDYLSEGGQHNCTQSGNAHFSISKTFSELSISVSLTSITSFIVVWTARPMNDAAIGSSR